MYSLSDAIGLSTIDMEWDGNQLSANTISAEIVEGFRAALKSSSGRNWATIACT